MAYCSCRLRKIPIHYINSKYRVYISGEHCHGEWDDDEGDVSQHGQTEYLLGVREQMTDSDSNLLHWNTTEADNSTLSHWVAPFIAALLSADPYWGLAFVQPTEWREIMCEKSKPEQRTPITPSRCRQLISPWRDDTPQWFTGSTPQELPSAAAEQLRLPIKLPTSEKRRDVREPALYRPTWQLYVKMDHSRAPWKQSGICVDGPLVVGCSTVPAPPCSICYRAEPSVLFSHQTGLKTEIVFGSDKGGRTPWLTAKLAPDWTESHLNLPIRVPGSKWHHWHKIAVLYL